MTIPPINWIDSPPHWAWLDTQSTALLDFYQRGAPDFDNGGFWWVDDAGVPLKSHGKQLWINARLTYAFSIGMLLGRPGFEPLVRHGIEFLQRGALRDHENGGWFWALGDDNNPSDDSKQSYGHAFVLLAASSAIIAGIDARALFEDALDTLLTKFWDEDESMFTDRWNRDFTELEPYRGQNANMHLVEALMTAAEVTGDQSLIQKAVGIAERLIKGAAAENDWCLPEHFRPGWVADLDYNRDDPDNLFRPYGYTIGHWLEWSRLLIQLSAAPGAEIPWARDASRKLFDRAISEGWDSEQTGFAFSTDRQGNVLNHDRYHWVIAEAIGAAVALYRGTGDSVYARWYVIFWEHAERFLINPIDRSWLHQLDGYNAPISDAWDGKPDLYHALQATLFARVPSGASVVTNLAGGNLGRNSHA